MPVRNHSLFCCHCDTIYSYLKVWGDEMKGSIIAILKYALMREREGVSFYSEKLKNAVIPEVKEVLAGLVDMERQHVQFIMELLEKGTRGDEISLESEESNDIYKQREIAELSRFSLESIARDLSLVRMAYLIEKDFEEFYSKAAQDSHEEDASSVFLELARWENGHKKVLMDLYEELKKEYWDRQGFTPLF
ncbi:MAG TPA: rubrerythrin [Kosmotogaceae bacterium]|nr:MAG: Rubrerythrin [Thermotogales bacterium 46_20]HAA86137.1 rubrerythrin [Kosmotogaceae bacterium]